jgi:hypothetical protein
MQLFTAATVGLSLTEIIAMANEEGNTLSLSPTTRKTMSDPVGKRSAKRAHEQMTKNAL